MKKREGANHNKEKIIKELKEKIKKFTISELSKKLGVLRQNESSCFSFLEGVRKVKTRQICLTKTYLWTEK